MLEVGSEWPTCRGGFSNEKNEEIITGFFHLKNHLDSWVILINTNNIFKVLKPVSQSMVIHTVIPLSFNICLWNESLRLIS